MVRQSVKWDPKTIPLSKSGVQMFDRCPYRFKLQVVDGLDSTSPEMEKGREIHDAVAKLPYQIDYDLVMSGDWKGLEEVMLDLLPEKEYVNFIALQMMRYKALKNKELFFPVYVEKFLHDKGLNYYGTFDRLDAEDNGSYIVIDWKSGSWKKWTERNNRYEMMGYKYLVEKVLDLKVKYYVIFFFRDGGFMGPEIPHPSTERAFFSRTKRVRGKIQRCLDIDIWPKKRQMCEWCSFSAGCSEDSAEQVSNKRLPRDEKGRVIP